MRIRRTTHVRMHSIVLYVSDENSHGGTEAAENIFGKETPDSPCSLCLSGDLLRLHAVHSTLISILFVAQGEHGLHTRGTASWDIPGNQTHKSE